MEPELIKQFRVGPKGLRYIRLASLGWTFAFCAAIWAFLQNDTATLNGKELSNSANAILNGVVVGVIFIFTIILRQVKISQMYKNLVFTLGSEALKQNNSGRFPLPGFYYNDIVGIGRTFRGTLVIHSSGGMQIIIPHFIDHRDEFEALLRLHYPNIASGPYTFYQKYYAAIINLAMALLVMILLTTNKIVMIVGCAVVITVFVIDFVNKYRRNKLLGRRIQLMYLIFPIGVIFFTLVVTFVKLVK